MIKFTNKDKNYYVKRYLEEYDEEQGLINIETSNKPFTILYKFIMMIIICILLIGSILQTGIIHYQ